MNDSGVGLLVYGGAGFGAGRARDLSCAANVESSSCVWLLNPDHKLALLGTAFMRSGLCE